MSKAANKLRQTAKLKLVIDTNVVFEGLTKKGRASGLLINAWRADIFDVYVSKASDARNPISERYEFLVSSF